MNKMQTINIYKELQDSCKVLSEKFKTTLRTNLIYYQVGLKLKICLEDPQPIEGINDKLGLYSQ